MLSSLFSFPIESSKYFGIVKEQVLNDDQKCGFEIDLSIFDVNEVKYIPKESKDFLYIEKTRESQDPIKDEFIKISKEILDFGKVKKVRAEMLSGAILIIDDNDHSIYINNKHNKLCDILDYGKYIHPLQYFAKQIFNINTDYIEDYFGAKLVYHPEGRLFNGKKYNYWFYLIAPLYDDALELYLSQTSQRGTIDIFSDCGGFIFSIHDGLFMFSPCINDDENILSTEIVDKLESRIDKIYSDRIVSRNRFESAFYLQNKILKRLDSCYNYKKFISQIINRLITYRPHANEPKLGAKIDRIAIDPELLQYKASLFDSIGSVICNEVINTILYSLAITTRKNLSTDIPVSAPSYAKYFSAKYPESFSKLVLLSVVQTNLSDGRIFY